MRYSEPWNLHPQGLLTGFPLCFAGLLEILSRVVWLVSHCCQLGSREDSTLRLTHEIWAPSELWVPLRMISSSGQAPVPREVFALPLLVVGEPMGSLLRSSWHELHRILITHTVASACSEPVAETCS